jgi:hypothetical protein
MDTIADLAPALEQYFRALEQYDIAAAVACFDEDAFYSHPAYSNASETRFYRGEGMRMEVHSREDLRMLLEDRGKQSFGYEFVAAATRGGAAFVAGNVVDDGVRLASFVSYADLGDDGLIRHYEAYSSVPPVGEPAPAGP